MMQESGPPSIDNANLFPVLVQAGLWLGAVIGYFGAWVTRQPRSAALSWTAYELFDLLRLLPEIETGAVSANLHTFRLPILGLAMVLPLLLLFPLRHRKTGAGLRIAIMVIGGLLCVMTLPPYPEILSAWHTPGWRVAFWWAVAAGVAVLILTWLPRDSVPSIRSRNWLVISVLLLTGIPAVITRQRLDPALAALHDAPVQWGFGLWLWAGCTALLILWLWICQYVGRRSS